MEYGQYLGRIWELVQQKFLLAGQEGGQMDAVLHIQQELDKFEKEAMQGNDFFALPYLLQLTQCDDFVRHVLYLLVCQKLYPQFARACLALGGVELLTPETAVRTYEYKMDVTQYYSAFASYGVLSRYFLCSSSGESALQRPLVLEERIAQLIVTCDVTYEPQAHRIRVLAHTAETAPFADEQGLLGKLCSLLNRTDVNGQHEIFWIYGKWGAGRKSLLARLAVELGREFVLFSPTEPANDDMLCAWFTECFLWEAYPVFVCGENIPGQLLAELGGKLPRLFVLAEECAPVCVQAAARVYGFALSERSMGISADIWRMEAKRYAVDDAVDFCELAGKFWLTPGKIKEAFAMAEALRVMEHETFVTAKLLDSGCLAVLSSSMGERAKKVKSHFTWDDLVLPQALKEDLKTACAQVRYRQKVYGAWGMERTVAYGKSVSMAFSGPPGTGKTMAAQVMAAQLGLELYRVELAAVVSKYVGETQKNLNEIFERASRRQVVLFFDEADVLFSKRTAVRESNDKYSNMEAAFLLQKMEDYDGVTILATNYIQNFDEAFRRRLRFLIEFPFPDEDMRRQIWQKTIPPQMPVEELDLDFLSSRFELSGSNIKNIVLHGAFLAASESSSVGMRHLMRAVRNEYAKLGKTLTAEDAGEYFMLL